MRDYVHEHFAKYQGQMVRPLITMKNGNTLSVQASRAHYCNPKSDDADMYSSVEVWFWRTKHTPKAFREYTSDGDPAGYVPVPVVNKYIAKNGGIVE